MRTIFRTAANASVSAVALVLGGCAIATPFKELKLSDAKCQGAAIVSVTEATVKSDAASRDVFWRNVAAVERSLERQSGLIGYSIRREIVGATAWTMTMWADETSLIAFVYGGRHNTAVAEASKSTVSMRFARFARDCALGPPDWEEALAALAQNGRTY